MDDSRTKGRRMPDSAPPEPRRAVNMRPATHVGAAGAQLSAAHCALVNTVHVHGVKTCVVWVGTWRGAATVPHVAC